MEQGNYNQPQSPMPKPDNYLAWAILCTVCCCLPFGIASIVYAAKVNGLYQSGDYMGAAHAAAEAKKWAIIGAVSGFCINLVYFVLNFIGAFANMAL